MTLPDVFQFLFIAGTTVTAAAHVLGWLGVGRGTVAGPEELPWAEEIP